MGSLDSSWEVVVVYLTAACACVVMVLLMMVMMRRKPRDIHLLPSPPGRRPIFGHIHLLQQKPIHQCFHNLSQTYGPLFYVQVGNIPSLVISSSHWAKQFLHTHDRDFVDRPQIEAGRRLFYNQKSAFLINHGSTWRHLRKLYTTVIFTSKRTEIFEKVRHDEMATLTKLVRSQASIEGAAIEIRDLVFRTIGNMFSRMLFSKRSFGTLEDLDGRGTRFKEMLEEISVLMIAPVHGDIIPWLNWLDKGMRKRIETMATEMDAFLEDVLVERIKSRGDVKDEEALDYLDLLLNPYKDQEDGKIDKASIKCILLDLLVAGIDTTTTSIEWAMAELLKNPSYLRKLQEELDTLTGGEESMPDKCLKDRDLAKLSYLQAVVKETLRLHPAITINFRELSGALDQGIQVAGYHLPKKTRVMVNQWSLGRDPTFWGPEAATFIPERFLSNSAPDIRGKHFEVLPFGTGRRGCPGMNLALTIIPFVVANLVQVVDWSIPNGVPLDLSEASAFITNMAKHLVAKPSPRTRGLRADRLDV